MDILANDLSIHEQFHDPYSFRKALGRLMSICDTARQFGHEVHRNSKFMQRSPMPKMGMRQAIGRIPLDEQRAIMRWLDRSVPFWEPLHDANNDWLECRNNEFVTGTAVGEAAYRCMNSQECGLVSIKPSDWNYSPVDVIWRREDAKLDDQQVAVENWWDASTLATRLQKVTPIKSWSKLRIRATSRFKRLTFADNCFTPLDDHKVPFEKSVADRFIVLLGILDKYARLHDKSGGRSAEADEMYQQYFHGDTSLFSDSSDTEKHNFKDKLTFPHPDDPEKRLFCTWHGKIRRHNLRLHFSWSIQSGKPVYIVYAGPKITK